MEEQFEYGEEVLVRDHDTEAWNKAYYLMTAPKGKKRHWGVAFPLTKEWLDHEKATWVQPFAQIRKIQKPEPSREPLFVSNQGVFTAEEAVMQLQERIEKILEELNEIKNQIKTQLK